MCVKYTQMGYWKETVMHFTLNHTRNISDSRAVVRYAEHPYVTHSFQVMRESMHKWVIGKTLMCFTLNHTRNVSDSRAVIRFAEHPYTMYGT